MVSNSVDRWGRRLCQHPACYAGQSAAVQQPSDAEEGDARRNRSENTDDHSNGLWRARLKTKGLTDLYVVTNVWKPGGTTGWHTHPGPSIIMVTAGQLTAYDGDDPTCTPHVFSLGASFIDPAEGTPTSFATRAPSTRAPQQSSSFQPRPAGESTRRSLCNARACSDSRRTGIFSTVSGIRSPDTVHRENRDRRGLAG